MLIGKGALCESLITKVMTWTSTHLLLIVLLFSSVRKKKKKKKNYRLLSGKGELKHAYKILAFQGTTEGTAFCLSCLRVLMEPRII